MFQKKDSNPARNATELAPGTETVIGPGVRVEGDLKSPSGVELLGTIEGSFEVAGLLVVRESGRVIGDVTAQDVIVQGAVEGRVIAAQRIELGPSGRIKGDMRAKAVSIAEGAYFEGKVEMKASPEPTNPRNRQPSTPQPYRPRSRSTGFPSIRRVCLTSRTGTPVRVRTRADPTVLACGG